MDLSVDEKALVQLPSSQVLRNNHKEFLDLDLPSMRGNSDTARKSINQGHNLDTVIPSGSRKGCTALYIAAEFGEPEIIEILLGKSAHYDLQYKWGSKPLQLILKAYYAACSKINDDIKKNFENNYIPVDINININQKFLENFKPLHFAVKYQLIEVIKILIENGIDAEGKDCNGMTALHYAVQDTQMGLLKNDHLEIRVSSINSEGESKIHIFSQRLIKVIDLLLKCGCDINAIDHFGRTPIFYLYDRVSQRDCLPCYFSKPRAFDFDDIYNYSVVYARIDIIQLLFSRSPALDVQDHEGNTILHLMAKAGHIFWNFEGKVAEEYLRSGGNVDALNHAGYTPLHYTCGNGYTELMNVLLQYGADVNLTHSEKMERPIHRAILFLREPHSRVRCRYKFDVVEQLLNHGAYVDAEMTDGMTPILMASEISSGTDNNLLITCLLNWGCDLNCADSFGRTPLHHICMHKNFPMLDICLKHGADINTVDHQGETPFSIVRKANRFSLDSLILFSYLKRLTILGVSLCDTNRKLYVLHNNMLNSCQFVGLRNKLSEILTDEQCRAQLEFMKTVHIDSYTTLYDILHKNTSALIHRVNNQKLLNILSDAYFDEDCSVYGYLVKIKIKNAKKRAELLKPAKESLVSILQFHIPDACVSEILSYLKNNDLKNLIEAKVSKKNKDETEHNLRHAHRSRLVNKLKAIYLFQKRCVNLYEE